MPLCVRMSVFSISLAICIFLTITERHTHTHTTEEIVWPNAILSRLSIILDTVISILFNLSAFVCFFSSLLFSLSAVAIAFVVFFNNYWYHVVTDTQDCSACCTSFQAPKHAQTENDDLYARWLARSFTLALAMWVSLCVYRRMYAKCWPKQTTLASSHTATVRRYHYQLQFVLYLFCAFIVVVVVVVGGFIIRLLLFLGNSTEYACI